MRTKASAPKKPLKQTMYASFYDTNLLGTGMEQVWQVLLASLAVATYAKKNRRMRQIVYNLLRWTEFCGFTLRTSVSADSFQLSTAKLSHWAGHHNPIRFRDPIFLLQYSHVRKCYSSKASGMQPFMLYRAVYWLYSAKHLIGMDGACSGC